MDSLFFDLQVLAISNHTHTRMLLNAQSHNYTAKADITQIRQPCRPRIAKACRAFSLPSYAQDIKEKTAGKAIFDIRV